MCKCTPIFPVEYCGKPGCEWPIINDLPNEFEINFNEMVRKSLEQIVNLQHDNKIAALICIAITKEGQLIAPAVLTLNTAVPLIGAMELAKDDVKAALKVMQEREQSKPG